MVMVMVMVIVTILVCKGERNLGRLPKLPRGALVRIRSVGEEEREKHFCYLPTFAPLGSLDTLPRLRSPLQTKMAGV